MIDINKLVRPNILTLDPYSSARNEFNGKEGVFLDANENPFGELNRYPDPYQKELKVLLSEMKGVDFNNIFIGNGSDEVIDLAFRIFCNPGSDKAIIFSPTYGMYDVSAAINNVDLLKIPLNSEFQIDLEKVKPYLKDNNIKIIFICSPNNPTGNLMNKSDIEYVLKNFNGIVILDEAYIDFAEEESLISMISQYNNLIVSQTFSKAWGLAAARVGVAYTNSTIIDLYNKIKPPYNISTLNQNEAIDAILEEAYIKTTSNNINIILEEKRKLIKELKKITFISKVFPSAANFILIKVENANKIYTDLVEQNIITRNRHKVIDNCIRVSIGTPEENNILINALKKLA